MSKTMEDCTRHEMRSFWEMYTENPGMKEMLLDHEAEKVEPFERTEIMHMLPDLQAKEVLELGAGIGRFTGEIAKAATHILAVDFMESYINKNKELNGHLKNITWLNKDATQLEFESASFNVVFSNWLLMYLTDPEVESLLHNILDWLKEDGVLFFRESCYYPSGNNLDESKKNPTVYRTPAKYNALLQNTYTSSEKETSFKILSQKPLKSFIEVTRFVGTRNS